MTLLLGMMGMEMIDILALKVVFQYQHNSLLRKKEVFPSKGKSSEKGVQK